MLGDPCKNIKNEIHCSIQNSRCIKNACTCITGYRNSNQQCLKRMYIGV